MSMRICRTQLFHTEVCKKKKKTKMLWEINLSVNFLYSFVQSQRIFWKIKFNMSDCKEFFHTAAANSKSKYTNVDEWYFIASRRDVIRLRLCCGVRPRAKLMTFNWTCTRECAAHSPPPVRLASNNFYVNNYLYHFHLHTLAFYAFALRTYFFFSF